MEILVLVLAVAIIGIVVYKKKKSPKSTGGSVDKQQPPTQER